MSADAVLGLDFGTTNTVAAIGRRGQPPVVVRIPFGGRELAAFRSLLSFREPERDGQPMEVEGGLLAAEQFAEDPTGTRLIQSFKTYAASRAFRDTDIHGKRWRFEDLMAALLTRLRVHAGERLEPLPTRVVVGRPVTFAGRRPRSRAGGGALPRGRLGRFGFSNRSSPYEPVGAAYFYARELQREATVLVAGLRRRHERLLRRCASSAGTGGRFRAEPLGHAGVGVAGRRVRLPASSTKWSRAASARARSTGPGTSACRCPTSTTPPFARWNQLAL
jgi:hypothetical chaperone protein